MNFVEYINASLAKGTIGAYISVGIFALLGVYAILGVYYGATRGFSKSVIRLFTVIAAAICSLFGVVAVSNIIVNIATNRANEGAKTVDALLDSFFPGLVDSLPEIVHPILQEMDSGTATVFVMMVVAIILTPVLFITFFYILKAISFLLYNILAGLAGAISFGKGITSTILGAAVGLIQGVIIASVIIIPIGGLCGIATDARASLLEEEEPNWYIETAYTSVIDDLADNPVFEVIDKFGGGVAYENMTTISIQGRRIDMGDICVDAVKVVTDLLPVTRPDFDWTHPTEGDRKAFTSVSTDIGDDDLLAALASDIVRGAAISIKKGNLNLGLYEATNILVNDVMTMFSTSTKDTIEGDLDVVLDVYFIMCDRHVFDPLSQGDHLDIRDMLTDKDENGKTTSDIIIARLDEYDRALPIVTSFTKITLTVMHGTSAFDETADELYDSVKNDVTDVLSLNKSDFETEEEYRAAIAEDLDKTFTNNDIRVEEDVKQGMIDYIAENYGDYDGEITEKEVNDALLSYYQSYSDLKHNENNSDGSEPDIAPDDTATEGTDPEGNEE